MMGYWEEVRAVFLSLRGTGIDGLLDNRFELLAIKYNVTVFGVALDSGQRQ